MALDFPNAPTVNQTFTGPNGVIWTWDGTKWVTGQSTNIYAPVNNPVFTGDPRAPTAAAGDNDTSVATTAFVQAAVAPALRDIGRNLIHNSMFNVAQRGNGPFVPAAGGNVYTADRWFISSLASGDTSSVTVPIATDANRAQVGDEAMRLMLANTFTGGSGAGNGSLLTQCIEDVRRLAGKTVTVSFWAVGQTATALGVSLDQNFGAGGSPSAQVSGAGQKIVLSGTTFTRFSLTFTMPSTAGKTFGTNGGDNTGLNFWYSAGSSFNTRSGNVGVQSGTIWLWGVQLEVGSTATPLEKPDPETQLRQCQRFYCTANFRMIGYQLAGSAGGATSLPLPVWMRANPTLVPTYTNTTNLTAPTIQQDGPGQVYVSTGAVTASAAYILFGSLTASADL